MSKWCPCSPCCDNLFDKKNKQDYEKVDEVDIDIVLPQYEKIPLDKVFEFKQPRVPMPVHPQISGYSAITEQPKATGGGEEKGDTCSTSSSSSKLSDEPQLHFSLYYDIQRRTLTIHLIEATNLVNKDRRSSFDPFVILFLLPNKEEIFESKIQKKTLNPVFNEVFEFTGLLPNEIRRQTLVLRLIDKDSNSSSNDIGTVVLHLEEADLYGVRVSANLNEENTVQTDSQGDVLISLMYNPSLNIITGILLKATNLQRMDISGSSDPYVKIYLVYRGEKQAKWKSTIKKKTLVPIYNEQFQFDVTEMEISYIRLEVSVMDYDRLGRNDLMGSFTLGEGSDHPTGRSQWLEMVANPRTLISRWHSLATYCTRTRGRTGSKHGSLKRGTTPPVGNSKRGLTPPSSN